MSVLATGNPEIVRAYTGDGIAVCVEYENGRSHWFTLGDRTAHNAAVTEWLSAGNAIAVQADAPTRAAYEAAVASHVNEVAKARGYEGAGDCASYASSTNAGWAADAVAFAAWRDTVWTAALSALDAAPANAPTVSAFVDALPTIDWP